MKTLFMPAGYILSLVLILASSAMIVSSAQDASTNNSKSLVLNAYIDMTGRALVTGYADTVDGLSFLNTSQYQYDNDTRQLYALTDTLTYKNGDDWSLEFSAQGYYEGYHVVFYLPGDVMLGRINCSEGLEFLLSTSNQSFMVDVQGYGVLDPELTLAFRQPLESVSATSRVWYPQNAPAIAMAVAILASLGFLIWVRSKKSRAIDSGRTPSIEESASEVQEPVVSAGLGISGGLEHPAPQQSGEHPAPAADSATSETFSGPQSQEDVAAKEGAESVTSETYDSQVQERFAQNDIGAIQVTSEMAAVMETLTAREKAVLTALIEHNGRMTQADIRYETGIPKSSLTGILISLERRKILIKKEWGRTNVIELSDWFLGRKERS